MNTNLQQLSEAGVSIWLDDLSRGRIESGNLAELINDYNVVGVTTNPTIFAAALSNSDDYSGIVSKLSGNGADDDAVNQAVFEITTGDVADAADIFADVAAATQGKDGRVSIEVEPGLARDTQGTIEMARRLWDTIGKENVFIKIPATEEGLPAITETIAAGISVNVTLVFSLERYRHVVEAYISGLEKAREDGLDLSTIQSVASIFISRLDTEVDKRLEDIGSPEALELRGKAGLANCRLAYQIYEQLFSSARWEVLAKAGAHAQRPLWASTGTKNPDYADTMYVTGLVTENVVNTMPEKTLLAFADHGTVEGDTVRGTYADSDAVLDSLASVGVDYNDVMQVLEREGLEKFDASWAELLDTVRAQLSR